jgi:tetratricopeptide (TPR) repeat protein
MADNLVARTRHVLPNFRRFSDTVILGEVGPAQTALPDPIPSNLDGLLAEWDEHPTIPIAADLIGASLVNGLTTRGEVQRAASFVLSSARDETTEPLRAAAERIMNCKPSVSLGSNRLVRIEQFVEETNQQRLYQRVATLKAATLRFDRNPILLAELARLYVILGKGRKAQKYMEMALALAPFNRFILRSAARMYAHLDDNEHAYDLLRRNPRTRRDPWLASAELAIAGLIGRETQSVKRAASILQSEDLSPASVAELASGLGSVELLSGYRKQSKRLFQRALIDPNANTLAQTEWAVSLDPMFEFDPKAFDVGRNDEALALEAFNSERWAEVIEHCQSWFLDTPFARRPVVIATHVASVVLDDFAASQAFCRAGLVSHPRDPLLLNNLAYALALDNRPLEALDELAKAPHRAAIDDIQTRACLTATEGLARFRLGDIRAGRQKYFESMEDAMKVENPTFRQVALLNYVREELLAKQVLPEMLIETVRELKIDPKTKTLEIFKEKVLQLMEGASASPSK